MKQLLGDIKVHKIASYRGPTGGLLPVPVDRALCHTFSADPVLFLAAVSRIRDVTRGTTTSMPTMMKRTPKIATSSVCTFEVFDSYVRWVCQCCTWAFKQKKENRQSRIAVVGSTHDLHASIIRFRAHDGNFLAWHKF